MTINTTDIRLLIKSVREVVLERVQCELFTGGLHAHVLMHMYVLCMYLGIMSFYHKT